MSDAPPNDGLLEKSSEGPDPEISVRRAEISRILDQIDSGDPSASDSLLPLVYAELRQLAAAQMRDERSSHSLTPTALVHEAYIRLVDREQLQQWKSRGHFFSAVAEAMRRILIEHARRLRAAKRGGDAKRVNLDAAEPIDLPRADDLIALDESLDRLEKNDREAAEIVKLRFFAGMTNEQAAEQMSISPRKANMLWSYARAWLRREIEDQGA